MSRAGGPGQVPSSFQPESIGILTEEEFWDRLVALENSCHELLQFKPKTLKKGYVLIPGGILNAYREGDLSFDEAVTATNRWKDPRSA
jgi:hypothetical protein